MIKTINGNLLYATEDIIGHQVNCQGVMGSGIALQIKNTFPIVFEEYQQLVDKHREYDTLSDLLGSVQYVASENEKVIANMFGQLNYGYDNKQYTNTDKLFDCFRDLRMIAEKYNLSVALPHMIGSYRGGANWQEVEQLLLIAFKGYEVTLYKLYN